MRVVVFAGWVVGAAACSFPGVSFAPDDVGDGGVASAMTPTEPAAQAAQAAQTSSLEPGAAPVSPVSPSPTVNAPTREDAGRDGVIRDAGTDSTTDSPLADAAATPAPTMTATSTSTPPPPPVPTATSTSTPAPPPVCDADGDGALNATCNGNDCNDSDARFHPGAGFLPENADFDCDGAITMQLPTGITCASLSDCTQGFAAPVACGATATYNICKKTVDLLGSVLCQLDHTEQRTQTCR